MHVSDEVVCALLQGCSYTSDSEISVDGDMNFIKYPTKHWL
jgi:hypothetical protein